MSSVAAPWWEVVDGPIMRFPGAGAALRMCTNPVVAGIVLAAIPNSTSACDTIDKPQQCYEDGESDECEALLRTDTDTCNAITRRRGKMAGAMCHASATQRYAACLRGDPIPPLNTWNN